MFRRLPNIPILLALLTCATFRLSAEGTRELFADDCNNHGSIQIWDNGDTNRKFATYNAPEDFRLHVRVDYGDVIHLGFHDANGDVWWRLKDPTGSVVMGPVLIQAGTKGWIDNCSEALAGPGSMFSGGYTDTSYIAQMTGDYYVELAEDNDPTQTDKRIIEWFDITVSEERTTVQPGRLWSRAWDINCQGGSNAFEASMFTYSTDSVVTKFDFNGIQPWGFTISCNSFGASDVGTFAERRKSDYRNNILANGGRPSAPEYPLFLNEPDINHFPEGKFGIIDSFSLYTCSDTVNCINVYTNKTGQVEVIMVFPNGSQINLIDTVPKGGTCFAWNGKDGYGNTLNGGDTVSITIQYATGITHLPLMDVENHTNGYTVELIRPSTKPNGNPVNDPLIFWNDSLLTDPGNSIDGISELNGTGSGSHQWQNRGTNNSNPEVINTWWYSSLEESTFIVVCPNILPIELGPFTGEYNSATRKTTLYWQSYSESDLSHYVIQRSTDGAHFSDIGTRKAANMASSYNFEDQELPSLDGPIYYRLQIVDLNGKNEYSRIIKVHIDGRVQTSMSWEGNKFNLKSDQSAEYNYFISDINGRTIQHGKAQTNEINAMTALPGGMYILQVQFNDQTSSETYKLLIQ